MWTSEIITAAITALIGICGGLFTYRQGIANLKIEKTKADAATALAMESAKSATALAAANQPIEHFRLLVIDLRERTSKLETSLEKSQEHAINCAGEVGKLRGEVDVLREFATHFRQFLLRNDKVDLSGKPPITEFSVEDTNQIKRELNNG